MKSFFNTKVLPVVRECPYDFVPKHKKKIRAWLSKNAPRNVRVFLARNFDREAEFLNDWKTRTRGLALADMERVRKGKDIVTFMAVATTEDPRLRQGFVQGAKFEKAYFLCPFCSKRVFAKTKHCVFCGESLFIPAVNTSKAYADYLDVIGQNDTDLTVSEFETSNDDLDKYIPLKKNAQAAEISDDPTAPIELDDRFEVKSPNLAESIFHQRSFRDKPLFVINAISKIFRMKRMDRQGELFMPITAGVRLLYEGDQIAMEFVSGKPHRLQIFSTDDEAMALAMKKLYNAGIVSDKKQLNAALRGRTKYIAMLDERACRS